ncbi:MAG: hypothetical protein Q8M11_03250 [Sulfuritalea sp.]|nr:hypothetical protein [Sulfuritalea sp.]MDP1984585.1 hypothetical protein [Sulfuritalea sp.]
MSIGAMRQQGAALLMLLLILGLVGAFFAMRIFGTASQSVQQLTNTTVALAQATDALIGYAASRPVAYAYLPCPDKTTPLPAGGTENDGQEDRAGGVCVVAEGNLPWVTLGVLGIDGWGNRLRYSVSATFSNSLVSMPPAPAGGTLTVNDAGANPIVSALPAVILSHGPNGYGATTSGGIVSPLPPVANTNERENTDGDTIFVSSPVVATGGTGGEFDDLTIWLVASILQDRMQRAGKLPP